MQTEDSLGEINYTRRLVISFVGLYKVRWYDLLPNPYYIATTLGADTIICHLPRPLYNQTY